MGEVRLRSLARRFGRGQTPALAGIDLTIRAGELFVIVGPSGCGKTTLLRLIAGLDLPTAGAVEIDGADMRGVAGRDRDIAMVFQDRSVYPHMSVARNIAFALRRQRVPRGEIEARVHAAAATVGVAELLDRRPHTLSGGQLQRVALARALVREPRVFLFDEPLSSLDAGLRTEIRHEIRALHRRLGRTMIHVTHDQTEAMALADRLAVMRDGRLEQVGPPHEVFGRPNSLFVARFLGTPPLNVVPLGVLGVAGAAILPAGGRGLPGGAAPEDLLVGIRPERLHVVGAPGAGEIVLRGTLAWTEAAGSETFAYVEVPGLAAPLCATLLRQAGVAQGAEVTLACRRDDIAVFDGRSGRALGADAAPAPVATIRKTSG